MSWCVANVAPATEKYNLSRQGDSTFQMSGFRLRCAWCVEQFLTRDAHYAAKSGDQMPRLDLEAEQREISEAGKSRRVGMAGEIERLCRRIGRPRAAPGEAEPRCRHLLFAGRRLTYEEKRGAEIAFEVLGVLSQAR